MRAVRGPADNLDAKAPNEADKPPAEKLRKRFLPVQRSLEEFPARSPSLWGTSQKMRLKVMCEWMKL